jgi:hypothetical protein
MAEANPSSPTPSSPSKKAKAGVARGAEATIKIQWNQLQRGSDAGDLKLTYDETLPRPPSKRLLHQTDPDRAEDDQELDEDGADTERVAVFNANTPEGSSMVRVLCQRKCHVVAIVRVFTSRTTKALLKLPRVQVKVADWTDKKDLIKAAEGCSRAFLVTKYWERFDTPIEEKMCYLILEACVEVGVKHLVLNSYEDAEDLMFRSKKSQLVPTPDGKLYPKFVGMKKFKKEARAMGVNLTHMVTSYYDKENTGAKKALNLIMGENGRLIVLDQTNA